MTIMKMRVSERILLVCLVLSIVPGCHVTDSEDEEETKIYVIVEEMPVLIGGLESLQSKINYPQVAADAGIEGRVIVNMVVNEQGRPEQVAVVRGIGGGCDEEAVRVVRDARFEPGRQRGEPVKVKLSLPITFRLT